MISCYWIVGGGAHEISQRDTVTHWTYGLGQVVRLEQRALSGPTDFCN